MNDRMRRHQSTIFDVLEKNAKKEIAYMVPFWVAASHIKTHVAYVLKYSDFGILYVSRPSIYSIAFSTINSASKEESKSKQNLNAAI